MKLTLQLYSGNVMKQTNNLKALVKIDNWNVERAQFYINSNGNKSYISR